MRDEPLLPDEVVEGALAAFHERLVVSVEECYSPQASILVAEMSPVHGWKLLVDALLVHVVAVERAAVGVVGSVVVFSVPVLLAY